MNKTIEVSVDKKKFEFPVTHYLFEVGRKREGLATLGKDRLAKTFNEAQPALAYAKELGLRGSEAVITVLPQISAPEVLGRFKPLVDKVVTEFGQIISKRSKKVYTSKDFRPEDFTV